MKLGFILAGALSLSCTAPVEHPQNQTGSYRGVQITGNSTYISRYVMELDLLYKFDPEGWQMVKKNIIHIKLHAHSGVNLETGVFYTNDITSYDYWGWPASEVKHDGCHVMLKRTGYEAIGREAEFYCLGVQQQFLRKIGYTTIDLTHSFNKRYWEIPFEKRDW
jgi:hypothetical protein